MLATDGRCVGFRADAVSTDRRTEEVTVGLKQHRDGKTVGSRVALAADGSVDEAATTTLREFLRDDTSYTQRRGPTEWVATRPANSARRA